MDEVELDFTRMESGFWKSLWTGLATQTSWLLKTAVGLLGLVGESLTAQFSRWSKIALLHIHCYPQTSDQCSSRKTRPLFMIPYTVEESLTASVKWLTLFVYEVASTAGSRVSTEIWKFCRLTEDELRVARSEPEQNQ